MLVKQNNASRFGDINARQSALSLITLFVINHTANLELAVVFIVNACFPVSPGTMYTDTNDALIIWKT